MKKPRWLDRRIAHPGPYLTLCLTEGEFIAAMRDCGIKRPPDWIKTEAAQATVHHLSNAEGGLVCVVCLREWEGRNPIEVAGLLVHEAVHAWQEYAERIGEHFPGREQEAYAIQSIAQELMAEFARRMGTK